VRDRPQLGPLRIFAITLSFSIAGYFIWAALTDAPSWKLAWFAVAAVQFLNVALLIADRRKQEGDR
jgi:hypothetical protein